ncbi:MAG: hypothetical protein ACPGWR_16800 [Ardenticatenaceae bacterium]
MRVLPKPPRIIEQIPSLLVYSLLRCPLLPKGCLFYQKMNKQARRKFYPDPPQQAGCVFYPCSTSWMRVVRKEQAGCVFYPCSTSRMRVLPLLNKLDACSTKRTSRMRVLPKEQAGCVFYPEQAGLLILP